MQPPKQGIVAEGGRRNILPYILMGTAALGAAAYLVSRAVTGGGQATVTNYPVNSGGEPATAATATPEPRYFIETDNARIEFPGLTEEEARPFIDAAYKKAKTESEARESTVPFNGVVTKGIPCNGRGCPEPGSPAYNPDSVRMQRVKPSAGGKVRVEMDCGPVTALQCDDETLSRIAAQSEEAYKFIMETLKPSKDVGIYVTVSADGKRANVTGQYGKEHVGMLRRSATSFYAWGVTDDFGQMTHEMGGSVALVLELVGEKDGFLKDFWGKHIRIKSGTGSTRGTYFGEYLKERSVPGLAGEVYLALQTDGFTDSDFTRLAQRLEGTNANWERFKAEAKAVAGRDLPTLNSQILDDEVKLYREIDGKKTSAVINDRSIALARILEENPGLNTPAYVQTYWEQFA